MGGGGGERGTVRGKNVPVIDISKTIADLVLVDIVQLRSHVVPSVHDVLPKEVLRDGALPLIGRSTRSKVGETRIGQVQTFKTVSVETINAAVSRLLSEDLRQTDNAELE